MIWAKGDNAFLLKEEGVQCENPSAPDDERVYTKRFENKQIYLPHEWERARQEVLAGDKQIILGGTGYSEIRPDKCRAWGVTEEGYVAACEDIFAHVVSELREQFDGIEVKNANGASDKGIDRAQLRVNETLGIKGLGFNCPNWMFFVKDGDGLPVFVAANKLEYGDKFVRSLDVLISAGGRMQALENDILAAIKYNKRLLLLNVLKAISPHGGPPARDGEGNIEDATAAFESAIMQVSVVNGYDALRKQAAESVREVARFILPSEAAYSAWKRGV